MSSAPTDCRVPDPTDAKADGNFGNHRAGYGDRLDRIIATARKGWTLAAGEGLVLVQEIDRLRGELELVSSEAAEAFNDRDAAEANTERRWDDIIAAAKKIERLERILAAVEAERDAARSYFHFVETEVQLVFYRSLADQYKRILAALREPSEAVVDATHDSLLETDDWSSAIRAAVEAAEREVSA